MNKAKRPNGTAMTKKQKIAPDTSDIPEVTDWSTAVRGRFPTAGKQVLKPVFVESDVMAFLAKHAAKTKQSESTLANELLRRDMALIQAVQPA